MNLMMMLLLMAGIGALLGGVVAILFGIPVKEFSFGNTLIVVGALGACTGLIMIGLSVVVGELKTIARRIGSRTVAEERPRSAFAPQVADDEEDEFAFPRDSSTPNDGNPEPVTPPLFSPGRNGSNAARARQNQNTPAEPEAPEPAQKTRRNLMFSSTSRRERERAQGRSSDGLAPEPPMLPPMTEPSEPQPPAFDDDWPKPERLRSPDAAPRRRAGRTPPMFSETGAAATARAVDPQTVTVLKSGIVDGMAYSLYSDGSIEAQMPEGLMRFASIDELRTHLDQRGG
jgi:hypothetical protein